MTARAQLERFTARRRRARPGTVVAIVMAFASAGCAGPAAPDGPLGRLTASQDAYVLAAVNGAALPAVTVQNDQLTVTTLADSIWLGPDGAGRRVTVERSQSAQGLPPDDITRRSEHHFRYSVAGGVIEGSIPCSENALCAPPPHYRGTLTGTQLRLTYALYYRTPLEYR